MDRSELDILLRTVLPNAEILIIKRDVELINKLFTQTGNLSSYIALQLIPYAALIYHEALEYINTKSYKINIQQSSKYNIRDIRNKAKFFDQRFGQILQSATNVDILQHNDFANKMKYPSLINWNIHDNLGIYFTSDKKIIGNTQYAAWVYQDENLIKKPLASMAGFEIQNEEARAFGYDVGRVISDISNAFSSHKDFMLSDVFPPNIQIYANDFNTNRCWTNTAEKYKPIQLLLVHMLSSIGFMLNVVKACILRDNGLLLRLEYNVLKYTLKRLKQLNQYVQDNKTTINDGKLSLLLTKINFDNSLLHSVEFGNCMRHYNLINNNSDVMISHDKINLALPLCGLVETHLNMDYYEYRTLLENELMCLYDNLLLHTGFDVLLSVNDDRLVD